MEFVDKTKVENEASLECARQRSGRSSKGKAE